MDPTPLQVFEAARSHLGDIETQGGELFTNDVLYPFFSQAYRELYSGMQSCGIHRAEQVVYYNLPAGTTMLCPKDIGLNNFGELVSLRERRIGTALAVETATSAVPIVLQITAHGLNAGEVYVSGMNGMEAANGRWYLSIVDPNHVGLIGSNASGGAYTSGGLLTISPYTFTVVQGPIEQLPLRPQPMASIDLYAWRQDRLFFNVASEVLELEITYTTSGDAPAFSLSSSQIGLDDSLNALSNRVAALAARPREGYAALWKSLAVDADAFLKQWLSIQIRSMPKVRPKPFRSRLRRNLY